MKNERPVSEELRRCLERPGEPSEPPSLEDVILDVLKKYGPVNASRLSGLAWSNRSEIEPRLFNMLAVGLVTRTTSASKAPMWALADSD